VLFGLQNDREWEQFATIVLERADLAGDPRCKGNAGRAANKPFLHAIITPALKALTSEEVLRRLEAAGIGNARVNTLSDVWGHPQLAARERWVEVASEKGGIPNIRPISGKGWQPRMEPVPALGEHTDAVLAEFGIAPAR
jgi:itaconate CoA-transferase